MTIGENIRRYRNENKFSQRDLEKITGIDHSQIARYERDKLEPSVNNLKRIAKALNISPDKLLEDNSIMEHGHTPSEENCSMVYGHAPNDETYELMNKMIELLIMANYKEEILKYRIFTFEDIYERYRNAAKTDLGMMIKESENGVAD